MFDSSRFEELQTAVAVASGTRVELASPEQLGEALRVMQAAMDQLEGLQAEVLHRFDR